MTEPTTEQRQASRIRTLERTNRNQAAELHRLDSLLIERKRQLELLGIAWSTRGAATRANQLTLEEVERLVAMVDRIQRRHFNTEYRIMYPTLDAYVQQIIEGRTAAWMDAHSSWQKSFRHAKRWKALAKKLSRKETP